MFSDRLKLAQESQTLGRKSHNQTSAFIQISEGSQETQPRLAVAILRPQRIDGSADTAVCKTQDILKLSISAMPTKPGNL